MTKKREPKPSEPLDCVEPAPERFRHDQIERAKQSRGSKATDRPPLYVVTENQLSTLLAKGHISTDQHTAGQRLYGDWRRAGILSKVTSPYEFTIQGRDDMASGQVDAYTRVREALDAVGQAAGDVLIDVCCYNYSPDQWAKKRGFMRRSAGLTILDVALHYLEKHYRQRRT